jgi:hypothetical protein
MTAPDDSAREMATVVRLRSDDRGGDERARTLDELLGSWVADDEVAPDDAARVRGLLDALAPCASADPTLEGRDVAAFIAALEADRAPAAETVVVRPRRRRAWRRVAVVAAAAVATTGLATGAGALPGPAQSVAHRLLGELGIPVHAPATSPTGGPGRGHASGTTHEVPAAVDHPGSGRATPTTPSTPGGSAPLVTPPTVVPPANPPEPGNPGEHPSATVATPDPGGTGTADTASGGASSAGTANADEHSDGHAGAGAGNSDSGQSHRP